MAKSKVKAQLKIQINDEMWVCKLWSAKAYEKQFGKDSDAITEISPRYLNFRDDAFNKDVVGHELMHAYFKYLHLDSVETPKIYDIEEIISSWIGYNFEKFYHKANLIYSSLLEGEKESKK